MAEPFLEEQLKRIRHMSEQISRVRALRPLHQVRGHVPDAPTSADADADRPKHSSRPPSRSRSR